MCQIINRERPESAIKENKLVFFISKQHVSLNNTLVASRFSSKRLLLSPGYLSVQLGLFLNTYNHDPKRRWHGKQLNSNKKNISGKVEQMRTSNSALYDTNLIFK